MRLSPLVLVLPFAAPLAAAPEDHGAPGPHAVGWRDVAWNDGGEPFTGRVHYPALSPGEHAVPDVASGPYPLLGFTHGQAGAPDEYDDLLGHVASWGWVIVAVQTSGHGHEYATDTKKMLKWASQQDAEPASFLFGTISDELPWSAMGHSWGGGSLQYLVDIQTKVRAIVALQPAFFSAPNAEAKLAGFDGSALVITGSHDVNTPPEEDGVPFYETATGAPRAAHVLVQGMAHYGPVDEPPPGNHGPLPHAEQAELNRRLATAFLMSEVRGDENAWASFTGETADLDPLTPEARCVDPPLWVVQSDATAAHVRVGAAGRAGGSLVLMASRRRVELPTELGVLGVDPASLVFLHRGPAGPAGWIEAVVPVPPALAGATVWLQAAAIGDDHGALSRTAAFAVR